MTTVTSFIPSGAPVNTRVTVKGTGFTGTTSVTFSGTAAISPVVLNDTTLTAGVSPGTTTGVVAVTSPGGTGTSASSFVINPIPTLTSFTPASGPVSSTIAINGTGFTGATGVKFNGVDAILAPGSQTQLVATVPLGATNGPISVTVPGGTATSSTSFVVSSQALGNIRAFPSAEGFGAESLGGRGPTGTAASGRAVYLVTELADPTSTSSVTAAAGQSMNVNEQGHSGAGLTTPFQITCGTEVITVSARSLISGTVFAYTLGTRAVKGTNAASHNSGVGVGLPGTFRQAIEQTEPRFVIFKTGGYVVVNSAMVLNHSYCYIAGQTAPGGGIGIRSNGIMNQSTLLTQSVNHLIIRHMRLRPGQVVNSGSSQRCLSILASSYVMVDHCSGSFGSDTNFMNGESCHFLTFQWNLISYPFFNGVGVGAQTSHARCLMHHYGAPAPPPDRITDHHNVIAHFQYREPESQSHNVEVYNQILYNVNQQGINFNSIADTAPTHGNLQYGRAVNNLWKNYNPNFYQATGAAETREFSGFGNPLDTDGDGFSDYFQNDSSRYFVRGNIGPSRPAGTELDNLTVESNSRYLLWTADTDNTMGGLFPQPPYPVAVESAQAAYNRLISNLTPTAGAYLPARDSLDTLVIDEVANDTLGAGSAMASRGLCLDHENDVGGMPGLAVGTAPTDSDNDGIPDSWWASSLAQALDSGVTQANHVSRGDTALSVSPNGYLWIENYINELAGDTVPLTSGSTSVTSRYGADSGGGYTGSLALSPFTVGHYMAGGDTWGCRFTEDGGNRWKGNQLDAPSKTPYGRGVNYSKRTATAGLRFWGVGNNQLVGGFCYSLPNDGTMYPISLVTSFEMGLGTGSNTNASGRRPVGQLIDSWVSSTDVEYIFTLTRNGGLQMFTNGSAASGLKAKADAISAPVTLAPLGDEQRLFVEVLDATHLVAINWDSNVTNTTNQQTQVFLVRTTATNWAGATAGNTTAVQQSTAAGPPAGRVYEMHRGKDGVIYAACGYDGVYTVALDGTGTGFTWTKISGTFFDDLVATVDATSTGVVYAGQCGTDGNYGNGNGQAQTVMPPGHAIAKRTAAGVWSWPASSSTSVHFDEYKEGDGATATGRLWWLRNKDRQPLGWAMDVSQLRVDPFADSKIVLVGRGGCWQSRNSGADWYPAMNGLNGGSQTDTLRSTGGQDVSISNQDDDSCHSSDSMKTGLATTPMPGGGTLGTTLNASGTTSYTGLDGVAYVFTRDTGTTGAKVTRAGTLISDPEFGWAVTAASQILVLANGTVLVSQSFGGCYVLEPTASAPLPTISSFTPTAGPAGTQITITGTNFLGATDVQIGTKSFGNWQVNSGTSITGTIPPQSVTAAIKVITPDGTATGGTFRVTRRKRIDEKWRKSRLPFGSSPPW